MGRRIVYQFGVNGSRDGPELIRADLTRLSEHSIALLRHQQQSTVGYLK